MKSCQNVEASSNQTEGLMQQIIRLIGRWI